MRGKMREAAVDLMIQRATRVAAWIPVNKCTCKKQCRCKRQFEKHKIPVFPFLVPCREEHGAGRHGQAGACWEKEIIIRIGSI